MKIIYSQCCSDCPAFIYTCAKLLAPLCIVFVRRLNYLQHYLLKSINTRYRIYAIGWVLWGERTANRLNFDITNMLQVYSKHSKTNNFVCNSMWFRCFHYMKPTLYYSRVFVLTACSICNALHTYTYISKPRKVGLLLKNNRKLNRNEISSNCGCFMIIKQSNGKPKSIRPHKFRFIPIKSCSMTFNIWSSKHMHSYR